MQTSGELLPLNIDTHNCKSYWETVKRLLLINTCGRVYVGVVSDVLRSSRSMVIWTWWCSTSRRFSQFRRNSVTVLNQLASSMRSVTHPNFKHSNLTFEPWHISTGNNIDVPYVTFEIEIGVDKLLLSLFYYQEEELFKWEQTTYPEVEAITKAIEPYQKLFTTIVKWQRAEKKWMDGAFLELNAEATEAEV